MNAFEITCRVATEGSHHGTAPPCASAALGCSLWTRQGAAAAGADAGCWDAGGLGRTDGCRMAGGSGQETRFRGCGLQARCHARRCRGGRTRRGADKAPECIVKTWRTHHALYSASHAIWGITRYMGTRLCNVVFAHSRPLWMRETQMWHLSQHIASRSARLGTAR
jgi:hypothetical protein